MLQHSPLKNFNNNNVYGRHRSRHRKALPVNKSAETREKKRKRCCYFGPRSGPILRAYFALSQGRAVSDAEVREIVALATTGSSLSALTPIWTIENTERKV